MIDLDLLRHQPELFKEAARTKKVAIDIDKFIALDQQRRALEQEIGELRGQRNAAARQQKSQPAPEAIEQGKQLKQTISSKEASLGHLQTETVALLKQIPNLPTDDTPLGDSEADNKVLRVVGKQPDFSFRALPHWEIGKNLDLIDNEKAAVITGSRFTYLKRELVWLQFALIQLALATATSPETLKKIAAEAGLNVSLTPFIPIIPPTMIKPAVFDKMGRLEPREERYHIPTDDLYLIGSAEHTLGPLHMDETFAESDLPLRYIGVSPAYRREAGSHGKDVRGILRLHQFDKVEMESFSLPETSLMEQDFIVAIQEYLMQQLELPYQVVIKCTADMGTPDARAIDIETWMPGQEKYRETHTSDLMTDFQSRALGTKVRRTQSNESHYVHMNDATAFAIGRTLIAIMENHQQADGGVAIPAALHSYLPFTMIKPQPHR